MKNKIIIATIVAFSLIFTSCQSTGVSRVSSDTVIDLSGFWNDVDVRLVCDDLINKCFNNPRLAKFEEKYDRLPVIIVGNFKNDSTEHIDTSIITEQFAAAILDSGKADFVADKKERESLREEKISQNADGFTSEDSAKAIDNETGADFMLMGSVKTIIQSAGNKSVRVYYVNAKLVDIEKNTIVWQGNNNEIKKYIVSKKPKL